MAAKFWSILVGGSGPNFLQPDCGTIAPHQNDWDPLLEEKSSNPLQPGCRTIAPHQKSCDPLCRGWDSTSLHSGFSSITSLFSCQSKKSALSNYFSLSLQPEKEMFGSAAAIFAVCEKAAGFQV